MESRYHIIKSFKEVKRLVKSCLKTGYCCYDFETNAKPLYTKEFTPTILSITFQAGSGISIPLDHPETKEYCEPGYNWKKVLKYVGRKLIENDDPKLTKIGHNLKFDNQIWLLFGIRPVGRMLDSMLAKYVLNEEKPHDLKALVVRYLPEFGGYEKAKGFDKLPWDKKPLEQLCEYGCMDTDCTFRLMLFFEKKLIDNDLYDVYRNLFMCNSIVLTQVERNGLFVDRAFNQHLLETYLPKIEEAKQSIYNLPKVKKFSKYYQELKIENYISKLEEEIESLDPDKDARKIASRESKIASIRSGVFVTKKELELIRPINLNSNTDLPQLMYSKKGFHFDRIKDSDSGKPSTDEETLNNLRLKIQDQESPKAIFLDNMLALRGLEKMYKTYILGWSEKVQDDSRLHGRYNIHGCVTGDTKLIGKEHDIIIKDICPTEPGILNVENKNLWVLSHDSTWEQVTHTINKGYLDTYKVVTESGDIIKCTKGHKLLTPLGMKRISYIFKHNIPIIMYNTKSLDIERPTVEGRSSTDVIYKEIPGWRGYLASSEGKIYSVKIPGSRGLLDYNHPHEIIPREGRLNGLRVFLRCNDGKRHPHNVSRLVWSAFNNTEIPEGMVIDHINCIRWDNRPENLQCITISDNVKRSYKCTRSSYQRGKGSGVSKVDTLLVGKILYDYELGVSRKELVEKYKLSPKQINRIINREAWKYLYLTNLKEFTYIGKKVIYDLSVNDKHSYITRSNFINSNTDSNRFSSADPNMQQIPKTTVDPNIKKQLIAPLGKLYLVFDYSQAELRMMAHLSGDETYLQAFAEGKDPHLMIAAKKYGIPIKEATKIYEDEDHPEHKIWKVRRKQAKQIAFGLIYGIGANLLAQKLSDPKEGIIVTKEGAQKEMNEFFEEHPKIKKFKEKQEKFIRKHGYYKQLFGTKRRLPQIYSDDQAEVAYAIRLGLNFPCQGAAANMTNFGAILLYFMMRQGKLPLMEEVATVHDAIYENTFPEYINVWTVYTIWSILRNPSTKEYFNFQVDDVDMDMDFTIGRSMAEELPFIPLYDYKKMLSPDFSVEEYMEEHKKYKDIHIKDFPKHFAKEMEECKQRFLNRRIA